MNLTFRIPVEEGERLRRSLLKEGFRPREIKHALWSLTDGRIHVTLYKSGVVLLQGKGAEAWRERLLSLVNVPEGPLAGCDESGKGDVFGPLVVCCAVIDPENYLEVLKVTPKDSKVMDDDEVKRKAIELKRLVYVKCVNVRPERLNELIERGFNLNRVLDLAYRKLTKVVRRDRSPEEIVIDRYTSSDPFGEGVKLIKGGESNLAVSVASVIARYKFLSFLEEHGLPKGSSEEVKAMASRMLEEDPKGARKLLKVSFVK